MVFSRANLETLCFSAAPSHSRLPMPTWKSRSSAPTKKKRATPHSSGRPAQERHKLEENGTWSTPKASPSAAKISKALTISSTLDSLTAQISAQTPSPNSARQSLESKNQIRPNSSISRPSLCQWILTETPHKR